MSLTEVNGHKLRHQPVEDIHDQGPFYKFVTYCQHCDISPVYHDQRWCGKAQEYYYGYFVKKDCRENKQKEYPEDF